jgi:hypothetical protein
MEAAPPAAEPDDDNCAVCSLRPRGTVLTGCGHAVLCEACTVELVRRGQPCPVCREPVDRSTGWRALPPQGPGLARAPSFQPEAVDPVVRAARAAKEARRAWRARLRTALDAVAEAQEAPFMSCGDVRLADAAAALTLCCDGVGALALPLSAAAVDALRAAAHRAPFGLDADTVVDAAVRDAWQLDAASVHLDAAAWGPALLDRVLADAVAELGVPAACGVRAELYKLVLYEPGGHFKRHRDTEKAPGMFGTLVVQLPVAGGHTGAGLRVTHRGAEREVDFESGSDGFFITAAFYADCEHELLPVTTGRRVCLVYSLVAAAPGARLPGPGAAAAAARSELAAAAAAWPAEQPARVVLPLQHKYTLTNLAFARLKGADARLAAELRSLSEAAAGAAAAAADAAAGSAPMLECALALIERELYGDEVGALREEGVCVAAWVGPDDARLPDGCSLGALRLTADAADAAAELLPGDELDWPDQFEEPDRRRRTRYTGNQGPDVSYWYHKAALVLWRREAGAAMALREGGVGAALSLAAARAARGDADAAAALAEVTAEGEARAVAAAEAAAARAAAEAAEDAADAAEGRAPRQRWHRQRAPGLGDARVASRALTAAAQLGAAAAAAACCVLRAMALPGSCGVDDAVVAPLANLGASPAACADVDAALAALVTAALHRGQRSRCFSLAASLAARGAAARADLVASAILAAPAEEVQGTFAMPREGALHDLALLAFAYTISEERAALAAKVAPGEDAEESDRGGARGDDADTWQGSSQDGSHASEDEDY